MKKESIKDLLESGFKMEIPYKTEINQRYGNISISKMDEYYIIQPRCLKLYDIDEAIDYFLSEALTSKNKGYIQERLSGKGIDFEGGKYDLERPSEELKKLFEDEGKLVDDEAKFFNIKIKESPKEEDAIREFEDIIKNFDIDVNKKIIYEFKKKFSLLDPWIMISIVFEPDGTKEKNNGQYRSSFDSDDLTKDMIEDAKSGKCLVADSGLKYKNLEIALKLKGNKKYYRYEVDV